MNGFEIGCNGLHKFPSFCVVGTDVQPFKDFGIINAK